jgi:hypothetical protein
LWCSTLSLQVVALDELKKKAMDAWSREELADWFAQVDDGDYTACAEHFKNLRGKQFASFTVEDIKEEVKGALGTALFHTKQQWLTPGML